ncbi:MAG: SAM-dependent chlorinase/fluorinase [Gemmatimonadaceae bacterium]
MPPLITLLTDFGTADGYVGEMKGVLFALAPDITIVDIAHDVPPQDVEVARLALARYWRRFPPGTIHMVVVDPGVGSSRLGLGAFSGERYVVGPDNGVLSAALLLPGAEVVALTEPPRASATFHGRDVFAPAAAYLARGEPLAALGRAHTDPVLRRTPEPRRLEDGAISGQVIAVDRFGNLMTNLIAPRGGRVSCAGRDVGDIRRTYADAAEGSPVALIGSSGLVEIAVRDGSAARALGAARGAEVTLRPPRP